MDGDTTPTIPFDDGQGDLGPLSDLRAAFEQRTAGRTLLERLLEHGPIGGFALPAALAAVVAERHGLTVNAAPAEALFVNGRLHAPLDAATARAMEDLRVGDAMVAADGSVVAARLAGAAAAAFVASIAAGRGGELPANAHRVPCALPLWRRPWDLLDAARFGALLEADIAAVAACWTPAAQGRLPGHATAVGGAGVHVHADARIGVGVVFDATSGPILVAEGAEIRHRAVLVGPCFIGPKSIVSEGAVLKARTAIGPQCRAAGEIGSVIFQGCSNKAHDGHLGDALVGEWVNLGAGTVNSNLLNTYGEVVMRLRGDGPLERTGRQFMGCILGDHAKTAIGTRIMTGSSVGTGAMWAAGEAIAGCVGAFAWRTDDGEREYRFDKFIAVARTVMARRGVTPGPAYEARLAALAAR
jgi:UDP-N-acetylglucosamine diphosphorylase/glucosamine-1-phosphate N-acetyltransferase